MVRFAGQRIEQRPVTRPGSRLALQWIPRRTLGVLALFACVAAAAFGKVPALLPLAYLAMSLVSGSPTGGARTQPVRSSGSWRKTLAPAGSAWRLAGGADCAAAVPAQDAKASLQLVFWVTVLLNVAAVAFAMQLGLGDALSRHLLGE